MFVSLPNKINKNKNDLNGDPVTIPNLQPWS